MVSWPSAKFRNSNSPLIVFTAPSSETNALSHRAEPALERGITFAPETGCPCSLTIWPYIVPPEESFTIGGLF